MKLDGERVSLEAFCAAIETPEPLNISPRLDKRIEEAHRTVVKIAAGPDPVYGLNTGLGANLAHRLKPGEISAFQHQIIAGRAVGCGDPLPEIIGRSILLARIVSAAQGFSGISPGLFDHLCNIYENGLAPAIPEHGSIGAGDLTQNAHFGLAVLGEGQMWQDGCLVDSSDALASVGLITPELQPKDGMVLVNHSSVTVARAAIALKQAGTTFGMVKHAGLLSFEGFNANRGIFGEEINSIRPAPGQAEMAKWFRDALAGSGTAPRRIQDALSFRTIAPVMGAASQAIDRTISILEDELNGVGDNPVVLADGTMVSTPNFHTPALALALETVSLALVPVANASAQRMQKLMNPDLSGLPKYLSPIGNGSAGFVPTQKTAAALLAKIRHCATPVMFDPAPVSDAVEDMAPMTPMAAAKLEEQTRPLKMLAGLEALVACQAIDLQQGAEPSRFIGRLHKVFRGQIARLENDRPLGPDIERAAKCLERIVTDPGFSRPG